jgi:steroid delta-isomerase-like uncharacterized protein
MPWSWIGHIVGWLPFWWRLGSGARIREVDLPARNGVIARRYFAELLAGDVALADEIIAENIDFYGPDSWGQPIHGREGFKGFVAYLRAAFPDLRFALHEEVVDEARVATRFTLRGTHHGVWQGIPPSGRQFTLPGADLFRIENGQISEVRVFYDTLGLMRQLGVDSVAPAQEAGVS